MKTLAIEKRDPKGKLDELRDSGRIPAVFYGGKVPSTPVSIKESEFVKAWKEAGESTVVVLNGVGDEHDSLIHDVDLDPVTGKVRHVDFYILEKGKKVQVAVPIEFDGVAPAVKELGGMLVKVLHELEIEAMPKDLPHEIKVDISTLVDFDSQIKASDIVLPSGVTLVTLPEEIVATAALGKEEIDEPTAPVDLSAIEVEKKGKEAKEGEVDESSK